MADQIVKEYYSSVIHNVDSRGLLEILSKTKANEVVIFSETEWECPGVTADVIDAYKNKNIHIKVVLGSFDTATIYDVVYWPTQWINWTYQNLKYTKVPEFDVNKLQYPFISLNNRSHYHRCVFIDEMAKQKLIDKGIVTWVKHLNENSNFPYQHFDNRQILLNDDFANKLDSFLFPKEYNLSLFHIVTEATHRATFITEKTAIPTLAKKPYIVLGGPNYNKHLVDLGFKLYDEIFDYSFDKELDIFKRTSMFVDNINRILNVDLVNTYNFLYPKIVHNYNRALEIIKDKSLIPNEIKECVNNNAIDKCISDRYVNFLND